MGHVHRRSPSYVRVDITDTGESVWVQIGTFTGTDPETASTYDDETTSRVVADPGAEPDVVVSGPAAALDAWLWRRGDDGRRSQVTGDRATLDHFRRAVDQPITDSARDRLGARPEAA